MDARSAVTGTRAIGCAAACPTTAPLPGFTQPVSTGANGFISTRDQPPRASAMRIMADLSGGEHVVLRDGAQVLIRQVRPADASLHHHDHEAIGALSVSDRRGVGIARYIRDRSAGIRRFTALIAVDDHSMIALLRTINGEIELVGQEFDIAEYQITLTAPALTPAT
jgi:hypothetical protein